MGFKNILFVWLLMAVLAGALNVSAKEETMSEPENIIAFIEAGALEWEVVNDGVMGGLSSSAIKLSEQGTGIFEGELSLENNGGFASVRTRVGRQDLSAFSGLELRVRGDGRSYQLRLRTDDRNDGIAYRAFFQTVADVWTRIQIPFEDFQPSYRGRVLTDASPLDTKAISQVAFMLADGLSGNFSLEIDYVRPDGIVTVTTVESVDLARYVGLWYEVARIPNRFQKQCVRSTTAEYTRQDDGSLKVVNRCLTDDGEWDEAEGLAKVEDPVSNAKLKVSFVSILGWRPFWGDYWVIGLDEEYQWSIVGTPDRKYGWVLARTPGLEDGLLEEVFAILERNGYRQEDFVVSPH